MEKVFKAAVVVFVVAAAAFFYFGKIDGVFIALVLASMSFFLSVRVQVKKRLAEREREAELLGEFEGSPANEDLGSEAREDHEREV
ncbi:MAG TPA: hypothetical protein VMM38_00630 [Aridibacter sp.]|nr:hypothetical protein [Aridibacter sp.]